VGWVEQQFGNPRPEDRHSSSLEGGKRVVGETRQQQAVWTSEGRGLSLFLFLSLSLALSLSLFLFISR